MTIESFSQVLEDNRISEVVILDDHSSWDTWQKLLEAMPKHEKIQVYSTPENIGMSENKKRVIDLAKESWAIIFDSDNVIDSSYLDALEIYYNQGLDSNCIYCPSFAKPNFDYSSMQGEKYDKSNLPWNKKNFDQLLNTANYVVHRETYLNTWKKNKEVGEADSIWHMHNHLQAGGTFFVVPYMEYFHRVHEDSGWMKNRKKNVEKFREIKTLISQL